MPLMFRSFIPYTIPGVLALVGCWWWYTSRKKTQITCLDSEVSPTALSTESSHLPTGDEQDPATQPQDQTTGKQEPDTEGVAPTVSSGVELAKAEVPEHGNVLAVPIADNIQVDLVKESLHCTEDDVPSNPTTAVDQCAQAALDHSLGPESSMVSASFPVSASTPFPDASVESKHNETSDNMEELQCFAAGFITEVISMAQQEVMVVSSRETFEAASSTTPTFYVKETTRDEDFHASHVGYSSQSHTDDIQQQAANIVKEVANGCLTPEAECLLSSQGQLELTPELPKLQAAEAITEMEDSECSTCQSEDGISSEGFLLSTGLSSAVPDLKEDRIQMSGISRYSEEKEDGQQDSSDLTGTEEPSLTREPVAAVCGTSLRNGTSDAEADYAVASDVDHMDSVDSCSILGTGHGQQSASQAGSSQSSELIVWEIEVPNHLVGRLTGKRKWFVRFLKQSSGAEVYVKNLPHTQEFGICRIKGTKQQVDKALALIGKKFKDLDMTVLSAPLPLPHTLLSHDELDPTPQKTTGFILMSARLHVPLTASE
ncbi:uncharacterized protein [Salminus brasiliensis]|uniref:uncharacterized protein n=1 Tax=Salminus brasiliensis TaxID=930266 RepID=UPI003B831C30